jgi:tetratricopeptide (TPR) repeat protein
MKQRHSNQKLWIVLGIVVLCVLVYGQVATYDFVHFDDGDYVYANPAITPGLTWQGVQWALTSQSLGNWHPLTWLSHMLDVQLFGLNAGAHHTVNVLLHILNSLLVFWIFARMTKNLAGSAFVAAIFAVHPLHVESVAWVAERKDLLSTFFALLTIWAYIAYARERRWALYVAVLVFYALGLLAKPMLVTLPFLLLLLDYWPLKRLALVEKIPLIVLAAGSSIMTFIAQREGHSVSEIAALPIDVRLRNVIVSYVQYLWKILWPSRMAIFYPFTPDRLDLWMMALLALIVLSVSAAALVRRYPYVFVGWFWFVGMLVPVIGFVQIGRQAMADRYVYLPMVGLLIIAAWGLPDILRAVKFRKELLAVASAVVILANGVVAWAQTRYWKDTVALWDHALDVMPGNYYAHYALANELGSQGKHDEAVSHFLESIRINPNYAEAHYNLGVELANFRKWDEARAQFAEAIRLDPNHASAHNNLANILLDQGRPAEAISEYNQALRISPDYVDARSNLAYALLRQGRLADAKRELSQVLAMNPTHPNALQMMRQLQQ